MWLVLYALKFRVTFYVTAILILLSGIGTYFVMPKDVQPSLQGVTITRIYFQPDTSIDLALLTGGEALVLSPPVELVDGRRVK